MDIKELPFIRATFVELPEIEGIYADYCKSLVLDEKKSVSMLGYDDYDMYDDNADVFITQQGYDNAEVIKGIDLGSELGIRFSREGKAIMRELIEHIPEVDINATAMDCYKRLGTYAEMIFPNYSAMGIEDNAELYELILKNPNLQPWANAVYRNGTARIEFGIEDIGLSKMPHEVHMTWELNISDKDREYLYDMMNSEINLGGIDAIEEELDKQIHEGKVVDKRKEYDDLPF